jgi:hypothetical protein
MDECDRILQGVRNLPACSLRYKQAVSSMLSAIAAANALQPTVHTVEALIARHRPKQHFLK